MGSEYYKKKFQDIKPDAPLEMTKKEKWINWWEYHWGHVLIAVAVVIVAAIFLGSFFFRIRPDYKVICVGEYYVPMEVEELQEALAQFGQDANGDGRVVVQVRSYAIGEASTNYEADVIALTGDISVCNSQIFIMDDAQSFAERYGIISEDACYSWEDCPALKDIDLGGEYDVALRTYPYEEAEEENAHAVTLWEAMTAGAE